jgi:hypothetical protein
MLTRKLLLLFSASMLAGCNYFTDAATRLAYDIEAGAGRIGRADGAKLTVEHRTPSKAGECAGNYTIQLDKVGAIIIWCKNKAGDKTESSHTTSHHRRFVDTPRTHLLEKNAGETLTIALERRNGRVVVADAK